MLKSVLTTLQNLNSVQKKLIHHADQKKTVLIERKIDDLNRLVKEETKLVKELEQLEQQRAGQVENLLQQQPSLTFLQFLEQYPDEASKKNVQEQLDALPQLVSELQAKNAVNDRLLKDSLSFVQNMIVQVTKATQQQFNYQSPMEQQKSQTSSRGFFDTKA